MPLTQNATECGLHARIIQFENAPISNTVRKRLAVE